MTAGDVRVVRVEPVTREDLEAAAAVLAGAQVGGPLTAGVVRAVLCTDRARVAGRNSAPSDSLRAAELVSVFARAYVTLAGAVDAAAANAGRDPGGSRVQLAMLAQVRRETQAELDRDLDDPDGADGADGS